MELNLPERLESWIDHELKEINKTREENNTTPITQKPVTRERFIIEMLWNQIDLVHICPDPFIDIDD